MLERMFDEERRNIIASSPLYTTLQELIDQDKPDAEIRRELVVTETTLERMKLALPVLDIKTEFANAEPEHIQGESKIQVNVGVTVPAQEKDGDEALVEAFEKDQQASLPTAEELAARDEALAMMAEKAKPKAKTKKSSSGKSKKKASEKKAASVKVVAGSAKAVAEEKPELSEPVPQDDVPLDDALAGIDDGELGDIDLDAVVANVQKAPQE